jgi:probable HAF family extracellular repeat protein
LLEGDQQQKHFVTSFPIPMSSGDPVMRVRALPTLVLGATLALFAAVRPASATPVTMYTVLDLGTLGGTNSYALGDINASGQVTGYSYMPGNADTHAFLYDGTTMLDLGTLGGFSNVSYGFGINASGQVAGYSATNSGFHAFLYDGTMHDLGTLGGSSSYGEGINDGGHVTGYSSTTGNAGPHAFVYDGTILHDLGTLGGSSSYGFDINASGQVTGYSATNSGQVDAFLYDGTMHDLGTLGGSSYGNGINASGQVTGYSYTSSGQIHAFLYDGTMIDLGTLGGYASYGFDINDSGQVVGSYFTNDYQHALLYSDGTMYDLNDLLVAGLGWTLVDARGINDSGQIAVTGVDAQGTAHALRLDPVVQQLPNAETPEPATLALLGTGLAITGIAARRKRR